MDLKPHVELHIEELVLHGFRSADRYRIGEAVQVELERLIAERGLPEGISATLQVPRLDGGSFQVGAERKPERVGAGIAVSVHRSMADVVRG